MAKVFAIANQKGGVGKTTTCINLAASLVATKRRVLLIDLDPQGNATMGSGVDKHGLENSIYDVLIGECDLGQAMHFSEHRSEEHTSELQSLMRISYAVFCLKKKKQSN